MRTTATLLLTTCAVLLAVPVHAQDAPPAQAGPGVELKQAPPAEAAPGAPEENSVESMDVGPHGVHLKLAGTNGESDLEIHVGPPSWSAGVAGAVGTAGLVLGASGLAVTSLLVAVDLVWLAVSAAGGAPALVQSPSRRVPYLAAPLSMLFPLLALAAGQLGVLVSAGLFLGLAGRRPERAE